MLRIITLAAVTALAVFAVSLYLPIGEGDGTPGLVICNAPIATLFATLCWCFGLDRNDRHAATCTLRTYLASKAPYR